MSQASVEARTVAKEMLVALAMNDALPLEDKVDFVAEVLDKFREETP